jgi:hypothetical protein
MILYSKGTVPLQIALCSPQTTTLLFGSGTSYSTGRLLAKIILALTLVVLMLLLGCNVSSMTLRVVDERAGEMYVTFSNGTDVKVGDIFQVYQTVVHSGGGGGGHQHGSSGAHTSREVVATVKVVSVIDETTAQIFVIAGKVVDGLPVQKIR